VKKNVDGSAAAQLDNLPYTQPSGGDHFVLELHNEREPAKSTIPMGTPGRKYGGVPSSSKGGAACVEVN
jgi:hypothetical protein